MGHNYDANSAGRRKKEFVESIKAEQSALSLEIQNIVRGGGSVFGEPRQ
jgi:hypothetical protein